MEKELQKQGSCINCRELLYGDFCHKCGEKVIHPKHDYSITEFIEQTVDDFTHFDSKIINTFKKLCFKPGVLTQNYIEGRRVRLMRPIQIFIICNLLFFLFMPKSGSFYASYDEMVTGYEEQSFTLENPFKYNINQKLKEISLKEIQKTKSKESINIVANRLYAKIYEKSAVNSKAFLFFIIPIWGLFLLAIFYRQNHYFVSHLIFAIHTFSFFILLDLLFLIFYFEILNLHVVENHTHLLPFFIWVGGYIVLGVKTFYKQPIIQAIWKGALAYVILLFLLILYRSLITIYTFNSF